MRTKAPKSPRLAKNRAKKQPDLLAKYRAKRDFKITAEPAGHVQGAATGNYVIQKHDASRLHYDFRLEIDGVLKSWAVPKGIPTVPGEKHLAVMVEDHPVEYGTFEGTIPKGQYGGGTVMLWDRGTFEIQGGNASGTVRQGKLHFTLRGEKLNGEWALIRMQREENQWLLIKAGAELKIKKRVWDKSVETARSMEEIAKKSVRVWTSKGSSTPDQSIRKKKFAGKIVAPVFVEPMKCKPVKTAPQGRDWIYELKYDGYRFLALKNGREVRLLSRNENDFTRRFPSIAAAIAELPCKTAVLDGEVVAADEKGRPSFQLLQNSDSDTPVQAFVFDLLQLDGRDLKSETLIARKALLAELFNGVDAPLHLSPSLEADPQDLLNEITRQGLEGLVAKKRDSSYEVGKRSGSWMKIRCSLEQEFVIGGYTKPKGARSFFGAILVGYYKGKELLFAGRVGTGFDSKRLRALSKAMNALRIEKCPFGNLPRPKASRWGQSITRSEMARCVWIKPELVCQVHFTEWTGENALRHPAFIGMREDKKVREVVRET